MDYAWLFARDGLAIHEEQVAEHGGADGGRDIGLLESALARPQNLLAYGKPDFADLAYATGVARNHSFVDGNKRTAWMLVVVFLDLNGLDLDADIVDALQAMLALAEGLIDETAFAAWMRPQLKPQ